MYLHYDEPVYRPPSEASSLIIQVTLGCSYNRCAFCSMYKSKTFKLRSLDEIRQDLHTAASVHGFAQRIFLADGNALCLPTNDLLSILSDIAKLFPQVKRISLYGSPGDILKKSPEDLQKLKASGLDMVYLGIESGSAEVLKLMNKGVKVKQISEAGKKIKESGIKLSATVISGLGGKELREDHALATAQLLNDIQPDYLGLLTLMVQKGTPLYKRVQNGDFKTLTPMEVLAETQLMLNDLQLSDCVFRTNHASNYVPVGGHLPNDKEKILAVLEKALSGNSILRAESIRAL